MRKVIFTIAIFVLFSGNVDAQIGNVVVPDGHAVGIEKMILSKDGRYLYTADEQKVIMWDTKQHKQIYTFVLGVEMNLFEALSALVLSPDGNYLAVSGRFGIKCFSTLTGKSIFDKKQGENNALTFSADSKKIYYTGEMKDDKSYNLLRGILSMNLKTLKPEPVFICEKGSDCYEFSQFKVLKAGLVILRYRKGYQLADLEAKKIVFIDSAFSEGSNSKFIPVLNTNLIFNELTELGSDPILNFYDAVTGKKVFTRTVRRNWEILPSTDGKSFLLNTNSFEKEIELIDAEDAGKTIKKFSSTTNMAFIYRGVLSANNKTAYYASIGDIMELNLASQQVALNFKREIISTSNYEYNEDREEFRTIGDLTHYVAVDFHRMVVEKNVELPKLDQNNREISFSNTGDTISIVDQKKFFYNIKSKKETPISSALFGEQTFDGKEPLKMYFAKDGKFAYTIKNVPINNKDAQSLYQINLTTNSYKKLAGFQYFLSLDTKNDLIAAYDILPTGFSVKVWQLATGKQIFTKILPFTVNKTPLSDATFIEGGSKIVIACVGWQVFDMADGKLVRESKGYFPFSVASHHMNYFASTENEGKLLMVDNSGKEIYNVQAHNATIRQIYFSTNDSLLYTASSDNTIKVLRTATGVLLGTMYVFKDSKDYVFVHPTGRFDGTPEGIKKLYYVKNRKIITLDKIYEKFYTPGLYQRLVNGEEFAEINIDIKAIPKVKINYAEAKRNLNVEDDNLSYINTTGVADIVVVANSEDDSIDEIRLFHNGKIVTLTTRNLIVADNEGGTQTKKYQLALLPGINNIRAIALNSQRTESDADEIAVSYTSGNQPAPAPVPKPTPNNNNTAIISPVDKTATMYLMVVGINAYTNKINPLTYALPDATSFKEEIEKDAKTVLANVKTYFITDAKADKAGIINAFNEIKKDAKPQDVFVFYYAGHGYINPTNKEFYLVSADVTDGGESLLKNGVPAKELQQYAIDIQAQKQLFILDACQSAGAFEQMLKHDGEQQKSLAVVARSTGTHWMAASGSTETAKEFGQLGHGAFTYVLLQALKGQAASNKMITVNGMKNFLQINVPELVKKYGSNNQYPASYGFGNDFPVEIMK